MGVSSSAHQTDLSAQTTEWRQYWRSAQTSALKRGVYWFARPALDRLTRRQLSAETLQALRPDRVFPERGFPLETRRAWIDRYADIRGKTVLIEGTGTGWDTLSWLSLRPRLVVGLDTFSFAAAWKGVREHARRGGRVMPQFAVGNLAALPLADGSVDVVASDAVLEHCTDLDAVLREAFRVLRPGGHLYATYGPMWFCFGGDHFSGRGGATHGYSHVELPDAEYRRYFAEQKLPDEDAQSGGRYVELDLFSKLHTRQYLAAFKRNGFEVCELILEVSAQALAFKRRWPARFDGIVAKHAAVHPDDLLIKGNYVILRRS